MSEPHFSHLNQLPEPAFPSNLHSQMMRRATLWRYRKMLAWVMPLLGVSLLASTWNLVQALIEADVPALCKLMLTTFELNVSFISDFASMIANATPIQPVALFAVNLAVVAGVSLWLWKKFNWETTLNKS